LVLDDVAISSLFLSSPVLFKAEATAGTPFRFTLALSLGSKTPRKRLFRYRIPRAVNMDAHFPVWLMIAVIVAFEVEMEGEIHDNIDAATRIVNELHALVFVAISVCWSVRWRSMFGFVPAARTQANRKALARDKHKRHTSQNNR
jgi:hypothetical protein